MCSDGISKNLSSPPRAVLDFQVDFASADTRDAVQKKSGEIVIMAIDITCWATFARIFGHILEMFLWRI